MSPFATVDAFMVPPRDDEAESSAQTYARLAGAAAREWHNLRDVALLARDAKAHGDTFSYELHCGLILNALLGADVRASAEEEAKALSSRLRGEGSNGNAADDIALKAAAEAQLDEVARRMGRDPARMRLVRRLAAEEGGEE